MGTTGKLARSFLLASIVATRIASAAPAERFEVVGGCRGGAANGAYELRMPDGQLRVAGAFAQGRKTGTFVFWTSRGARIAVVPYDEDAKTGTIARWYTTTTGGELGRRLEAPYADNALHGIERSWHANGVLRSELRYEHGTLLSAQAWDRRGAPLPEAQARRQAAQDAAADERILAELEAIVQGHLPRCE